MTDESAAEALRTWARRERDAWLRAAALDPFLPDALHPPGYLGRKAWERRRRVLADAGRLAARFRLLGHPPA